MATKAVAEVMAASRMMNVRYAIRDLASAAEEVAREGHEILYLNIGDPCKFDPAASKTLLAQAFPDGKVPTINLDFFTGTREAAVDGTIVFPRSSRLPKRSSSCTGATTTVASCIALPSTNFVHSRATPEDITLDGVQSRT